MALLEPEEIINHPAYIQYLLSPDTPLDFHVCVGNVKAPEAEKLEQIKVVKWMLIAHSKVLRVMLLESEMRPKKSFNISDINLNTFKNFLVFIYGHDITSGLPFDDAVDLLSVAEKYDVAELKQKLGLVVKSKVSADNVLTILKYGPVCETFPDLWAKATEVIQTETKVVFNDPQFVTLRPEAVVHILQQDMLSVDEIDVWRASLAWAQHQLTSVGTDPSPQDLRSTLEPLLVHTRLCAVPSLDLSKEVAPTKILTAEELQEIMISIGRQVKSDNLSLVCNEIKGRTSLDKTVNLLNRLSFNLADVSSNSKTTILANTDHNIILVALTIPTNASPRGPLNEGSTYNCSGEVTISKAPVVDEDSIFNSIGKLINRKVPDKSNNTSSNTVFEMQFNLKVPYDRYFKLHLENETFRRPVLLANTKYSVGVEFSTSHRYFNYHAKGLIENDFLISLTPKISSRGTNFISHIGKLHYKISSIK